MSDEPSIFERRRDLLIPRIRERMEVAHKAFGVGGRPYGSVKLTPTEKRDYFHGQPPEKQQELWAEMDEGERAEMGPGPGGSY